MWFNFLLFGGSKENIEVCLVGGYFILVYILDIRDSFINYYVKGI